MSGAFGSLCRSLYPMPAVPSSRSSRRPVAPSPRRPMPMPVGPPSRRSFAPSALGPVGPSSRRSIALSRRSLVPSPRRPIASLRRPVARPVVPSLRRSVGPDRRSSLRRPIAPSSRCSFVPSLPLPVATSRRPISVASVATHADLEPIAASAAGRSLIWTSAVRWCIWRTRASPIPECRWSEANWSPELVSGQSDWEKRGLG